MVSSRFQRPDPEPSREILYLVSKHKGEFESCLEPLQYKDAANVAQNPPKRRPALIFEHLLEVVHLSWPLPRSLRHVEVELVQVPFLTQI
jgi:hypothetical protein